MRFPAIAVMTLTLCAGSLHATEEELGAGTKHLTIAQGEAEEAATEARRILRRKNTLFLNSFLQEEQYRCKTTHGWLYWYHPSAPQGDSRISLGGETILFLADNGLLNVFRWREPGWVELLTMPGNQGDADRIVNGYLASLEAETATSGKVEFIAESWCVMFTPRIEKYPGGSTSTISAYLSNARGLIGLHVPADTRPAHLPTTATPP